MFNLKYKKIKNLKDKIKKMRKSGLEKDGEYSVENLVFKVLRSNGTLDKITKLADNIKDNTLSITKNEKQ